MPETRTTPTEGYSVDSVTNALRILVMLREEPELGVVDVARGLGVARSTAHRLLTTLARENFVRQESAYGKYRLGAALSSFNPMVAHRRALISQARPYLEQIAADTGETCQLNVLEGQNVRYIDGAEGPNPLRVVTRVGVRIPANISAGGKAQLAILPDEKVEALFSVGLASMTPRSIIDVDAFLAELAVVRRQGYATNIGESATGMNVIGAAIVDVHGIPVAGLTIAGPDTRMQVSRMEELAPTLLEASRMIGDSL